jgi:hypothetical protein
MLTDSQYLDLAMRICAGELRRVVLSDGRSVLVDGDEHTDDEIRTAYENP